MTEKDLILKIKQLKEIKPRQEWVVLTKQRIMAERQEVVMPNTGKSFFANFTHITGAIFNHRFAVISLSAVFVFTGLFASAQNSVPGDTLFLLRKVSERARSTFAVKEDASLNIVNNRLDDIIKIANENKTKRLEPALKEYNTSVSKVASEITKDNVKNNPEKVRKVVDNFREIENKVTEIHSLGIILNENPDLDVAFIELVTEQAKELEGMELNGGQAALLQDIQLFLSKEKYLNALDQILEVNQNIKEQRILDIEDNTVNTDKEGGKENNPVKVENKNIEGGVIFK